MAAPTARALIGAAALILVADAGVGAPIQAPSTAAPSMHRTYQNPILHADYSDPDVIRVGDDYWMTSSSFSHVPALPILHSRDLVNWNLVNHAIPRLVPEDVFATPQHGKGVWAPSFRHRDGVFMIYYGDPDFGIYTVRTRDPLGKWDDPILVKEGKGLIDSCPFWDDDGSVYLVHAWAKSRAGFNNVLTLLRLDETGTHVVEDFGIVVDGNAIEGCRTLEGPKLYKREGWYYIFAPAGGVEHGWQSVFRSRDIRGPYEHRIVLAQGSSPVNGPHQGAWIDTTDGSEDWFIHFQDKGAYGRIVHLQPMSWKDGWPLMGTGVASGTETGEPVIAHPAPRLPSQTYAAPPTTDEFDSTALGLQWQWQANSSEGWHSLDTRHGWLRLNAVPPPESGNLYDATSLLMQKFPAEAFTVTVSLDATALGDGDGTGLIVFGYDYAWVGVVRERGSLVTVRHTRVKASEASSIEESRVLSVAETGLAQLRLTVSKGAVCRFQVSTDGINFTEAGCAFTATVGRWVGAKFGLFASGTGGGCADFDWVRVEKGE